MSRGRTASILCLAAFWPVAASAHSVTQTIGAYNDNNGLQRERVAFDVLVDGGAHALGGMTDSTYAVTVQRDQFHRTNMKDDDFDREIYQTSYNVNDYASVSANQTWDKVTETRVLAAYGSDHKIRSRTWATGASQWLAHETVRVSFDLSRTIVERPLFGVLDFDSVTTAEPTISSQTGATLGVRHLARATTVIDYTVGHTVAENRPPADRGGIAIRQFVPALDGALHASATRALNRGYVASDTTYGQVDSWIGEVAWFQSLWKGALSKIGYRYYREDETTRAYGDELQFGSDTITAGLSQELPKGATSGLSRPLTLELKGARYLTNVRVAAATVELGVTAKF